MENKRCLQSCRPSLTFRIHHGLAIIFLFVVPFTQAQSDSGKFTLQVGYGIGSLFFTPNIQINSPTAFDIDSQSVVATRTDYLTTEMKIRPILVKLDYALNERSQLGMLFMYNGYVAQGIRLDSAWVQSSNSYTTELKNTRLRMNRIRIEVAYTHLFRQKRDWARSYFYAGFGWNGKFVRYFENDQKRPISESIYYENFYFPIAMRFAYGFRIRVSDRFSIQNEFGLGGPLYTLGISCKL